MLNKAKVSNNELHNSVQVIHADCSEHFLYFLSLNISLNMLISGTPSPASCAVQTFSLRGATNQKNVSIKGEEHMCK